MVETSSNTVNIILITVFTIVGTALIVAIIIVAVQQSQKKNEQNKLGILYNTAIGSNRSRRRKHTTTKLIHQNAKTTCCNTVQTDSYAEEQDGNNIIEEDDDENTTDDTISNNNNKGIVAYFCGSCPVRFSPQVGKLGGSETAVVELAREWQKKGYQVIVYATVNPGTYDGVVYVDHSLFDHSRKTDYLVVWRLFGCKKEFMQKLNKNNYKSISLDLHDGDPFLNFPLKYMNVFNKIMLKSEYQRSLYSNKFKDIDDSKVFDIIPNGVTDIEEYRKNRSITKDPMKLVYTSCYMRGLEGILRYAWPKIVRKFPLAKLHLFYGMELVGEGEWKTTMRKLIKNASGSVIDHGRMERSEVRKQCADAMIHFYPCVASCEIDCISVKETALAGILPVIPNSFVFSERAGMHFDGTPNSERFFDNAAGVVSEIMSHPEKYKELLEKRVDPLLNRTVMSWTQVAERWTHDCFDNYETEVENMP